MKCFKYLLILIMSCLVISVNAADQWENINTAKGLPHDEIRCLYIDNDRVLIGTMDGLAELKAGKVTNLGSIGQVNEIRKEKDYFLIATSSGLFELKNGKTKQLLKGYIVSKVVNFVPGTDWLLVKQNEVNSIVSGSGSNYQPVIFFTKRKVEDLFRDSSGTIWVAIDGDGVFAVNPKESVDKAKHFLEGVNVTYIFEDADKKLWCGTHGRGVFVYDGKEWTRELKKEKSIVFRIVQDTGKNIWIATSESGLYRQENGKWINDLKDEGSVNLIYSNGQGKVWVSTAQKGGLRYWDGKSWHDSLASPLPIFCIAEKGKSVYAGGILDGLHVKK